VFFATGWTGHGFAIAPAVAQLLAEWVLTGRPETELLPFGLARLGLASTAA
jgi:sarcosine oxidase subunit beta